MKIKNWIGVLLVAVLVSAGLYMFLLRNNSTEMSKAPEKQEKKSQVNTGKKNSGSTAKKKADTSATTQKQAANRKEKNARSDEKTENPPANTSSPTQSEKTGETVDKTSQPKKDGDQASERQISKAKTRSESKDTAANKDDASTANSKQSTENTTKNDTKVQLPPKGFTLDEILTRVDKLRGPSEQFLSELKIISKKGLKSGKIGQSPEWEEQKTRKFELSVGSPTKSLVKFIYPPTDRGKFLLMNGDNLWFYTQKTRNPIRITPQQRLIGQVSNGDVARVVFSTYYKPTKIENATIKKMDGAGKLNLYRLHLNAKEVATYDKIKLYIRKENFRPYKADFYSLSGKRLKTAYYREYEPVLGKKRPTKLKIIDQLRNNQVSTMKYTSFKRKDFPSHFFQKSYLKYQK